MTAWTVREQGLNMANMSPLKRYRALNKQILQLRDGRLELNRTLMPSMLSRDARAVRQDCLCYFMERLPPP